MGGRGASGGIEQSPTNARRVENMNEAQIKMEIAREQRTIKAAENAMRNNDITQTARSKAMREAFPLGAGGGRLEEFRKSAEKDARMAQRYAEANERKNAAQIRLENLKSAQKQIAGTGKTQRQVTEEKRAAAVKSAGSTMKWTTTNKGGWSNGGYTPKTIKSGSFEIKGSSGMFTVYENGKQVGRTSKLSEAKAIAERRKRRK